MRSTRRPARHALKAGVLALEVLVAHQRAHELAGDLFPGVAEQTLGAGVPMRDAPLAVGADDRVVGGLDDGGHQLGGGLGAPQIAHVAVGDEDAVSQLHGAHLEHTRDARAADEAVELDLHLPGRAGLDHVAVGLERAGVAEGRHEVQQPVVDDLVDPHPADALEGRVGVDGEEVDDRPVVVAHRGEHAQSVGELVERLVERDRQHGATLLVELVHGAGLGGLVLAPALTFEPWRMRPSETWSKVISTTSSGRSAIHSSSRPWVQRLASPLPRSPVSYGARKSTSSRFSLAVKPLECPTSRRRPSGV
jgi:hypothetical protein